MATNIGKVGIVMKGDWNNSSTYEVLDAVTYSGSLYIAKRNVPANTTPTNTTYWQLATDLTAKADKVTGATANNLAALDGNGNLIDSLVPLSAVTHVNETLMISSADTVDITYNNAGVFLILFIANETNTNVYGAALNVGFSGGSARNKLIILEKGSSVNQIEYISSSGSSRLIRISFTGTAFSDLSTNFYAIPLTRNTFNISKTV